MHRGWDHSVDHLWSAGFLCEQQNIAPADRIPMHIFPEALPVERWFNESKVDVVPDPLPFNQWFQKHRPEVVISKASFVLPQLKEMGLRVPQDVGFVDVFLEEAGGKAAGVRQNHATVGELAVEILAASCSIINSACPRFRRRPTWKAPGSMARPARCRRRASACWASARPRECKRARRGGGRKKPCPQRLFCAR